MFFTHILYWIRVGFLYGKFNEDKTVKVELIYEPPQETTDTSFTILPDSREVRYNNNVAVPVAFSCLHRNPVSESLFSHVCVHSNWWTAWQACWGCRRLDGSSAIPPGRRGELHGGTLL
jgi:hypothetical protein